MTMTSITSTSAADVIDFWREAGKDRWFEGDESFDREIRQKFETTWHAAARGERESWQDTDEGLLALVIVLDQFPRNMFRGGAQMFATDARARDVARIAIARGTDQRLDKDMQGFLYMPFMHSEAMADQERCVALFKAARNDHQLEYAQEHAGIIRRFSRFPHRNAILGRATTAEEKAFLDNGGFSG